MQTSDEGGSRRTRRRRDGVGESRTGPAMQVTGGRLAPLEAADLNRIHEAALTILDTVGLSEAPDTITAILLARGARVTDGRLCLPRAMVETALADLPRRVVLAGQAPDRDLVLEGARVFLGTGGAAPMLVDLETDSYRPSTLRDLHDAARLVDALDHVAFFSRPLVARDVEDPRALDINTAYAALAGTTKHVIAAASDPAHVRDIARLCHLVAGSEEAFRARPFLSLNINHVVPPLRLAAEACEVLVEAVRHGIPVQVNTFGQMGASSPVTMAGCLAQTVAETLAGMVLGWAVDPDAALVFGPRPMITDLRTGAMAGGSGEQALLTAAAVQMARFYDLPCSTIAGATDAKLPDAQSGYEKALAVTLAAQTGANLVTQACGMQAGLMGCSFEAYVTDNDMLGAILRSLSPVAVDDATLSVAAIAEVVRGEGHFLGHPDTFARMQSDFLYPAIADRRSPDAWAAAGSPDIRAAAKARAREVLARHHPAHVAPETDAAIRAEFPIHLPQEASSQP